MNVHRQPTIDEIISLVQKQDSQAGKKPPEGGHTPELSPVVPAGEPEQERGLFLIVGLGNPGRKYLKNRHNVGFMVLDHLAEKLGVTFTRLRSKALVTEAKLDDRRLILAKPQGYMNTSGQVVGALVRFYKVSLTCCLVIHDDVDLPLGTLRLRPGGSSGGQKGVASIIERLGRQDFPRLRLGIGRPPGYKQAAGYVLQDFSRSEEAYLKVILEQAAEAVQVYISQGLDQAMNQFNGVVSE